MAISLSGSKRIKDLPLLNRPREKALRYGINALSDEEILAILISSGIKNYNALTIAKNLLKEHQGLYNLSRINEPKKLKTKGLSDTRSLMLIAAFTLASRIEKDAKNKPLRINASSDILSLYQHELSKAEKEHLYLLMLNQKREIIKEEVLYLGTSEGFEIDLKEIVRRVLIYNAVNVILVHNHPSGNVVPSTSDIEATIELNKALIKHDITLLDHVIIGAFRYFSFAENSLINNNKG